MSKSSPTIKTIIPLTSPVYAGFLPDSEHDIDIKITPIVCWSLVSFDDSHPDEVIGQIIAGDTVVEVTYVDEEEGFGPFLGYFHTEESARISILEAVADSSATEEEEEGFAGEEEEEGSDDEEEDDEEEGDEDDEDNEYEEEEEDEDEEEGDDDDDDDEEDE